MNGRISMDVLKPTGMVRIVISSPDIRIAPSYSSYETSGLAWVFQVEGVGHIDDIRAALRDKPKKPKKPRGLRR